MQPFIVADRTADGSITVLKIQIVLTMGITVSQKDLALGMRHAITPCHDPLGNPKCPIANYPRILILHKGELFLPFLF